MTNYLARIAASGARIGTPARPPVSGPPVMPNTLPDFSPPAEIDKSEISPVTAEPAARPASPVNASSPNQPNTAPPAAAIPPVSADRTGAAEPVARPVRFDQPQAAMLALGRPAQPEPVRRQEQHEKIELPLRALSRLLAPEAMPMIQAPKALRPPEPAPQAAQVVNLAPVEAMPQSIMNESKNRPPDPAPIKQPPAAPVLDGIASLPERAPNPALPPLPATPSAEPAVTAAQFVEPPPRKEARITIGRLDVQVNNHPPAPPPVRTAAPVTNNAPDALERRYLDRFRLKP